MGLTEYRGLSVRQRSVRSVERQHGIGVAIDRAGMALSLCCGLHCIGTPLLLGAAVGLPFGWLVDELTEVLLLTAAIGSDALSLGPSYRRWLRRKPCLGCSPLERSCSP